MKKKENDCFKENKNLEEKLDAAQEGGAKKKVQKYLINANKGKSVVIDDQVLTMYERTCADDFPIIEQMQNLILQLSKMYGKDSMRELEEFLHGLSYVMQYTIGMRIMDFHYHGVLVPTGVKHVDEFLSTFKKKLRPFPQNLVKQYFGDAN